MSLTIIQFIWKLNKIETAYKQFTIQLPLQLIPVPIFYFPSIAFKLCLWSLAYSIESRLASLTESLIIFLILSQTFTKCRKKCSYDDRFLWIYCCCMLLDYSLRRRLFIVWWLPHYMVFFHCILACDYEHKFYWKKQSQHNLHFHLHQNYLNNSSNKMSTYTSCNFHNRSMLS